MRDGIESEPPGTDGGRCWLIRLTVFAGAAFFGVFGYTVWARAGFPYEYNWSESDMFEKVLRAANGLPLYTAPSLEYASDLYTPLYYYVGALILEVLGESLPALRALSYLSIVFCCVYIALFAYRETKKISVSALALGLFGLYYGVCDGLLDIARVDALFLFLLLATIYHGTRLDNWRRVALVTALWVLSFHTKQTTLFLAGPLVLFWVYDWGKRGIWTSTAAFAITGLITAALTWATDGWYWFYVFEYGRSVPRDYPNLLVYLWWDLLRPFWPALLFSAVFFAGLLKDGDYRKCRYYACILAAAILGTGLTRTHVGSGNGGNVLIPLSAVMAILAPLGWMRVLRYANARGQIAGGLMGVGAVFLVFVHMGLLAYRPSTFLATTETTQAWEELEHRLTELPGDVYLSRHGFLAEKMGKKAYAHASSVMGLDLLPADHPVRVQSERVLHDAIVSGRFSAWVLHRDRFLADLKRLGFEDRYELRGMVARGKAQDRGVPYCGPAFIYTRKE